MPEALTDDVLARMAVRLACENAAGGALPFGALVVKGGAVLATGVNTALADHDPSAHAEAAAVRAACRQLRTLTLSGATLVASCEPCAICLSIAFAAGVERVIYAATREQVPDLGTTLPQIVAEISAQAHSIAADRIEHVPVAGSDAPFELFLAGPRMVKQLRLVVEAEDFDEAVVFYRDVLGLPVEFSESEGEAKVMALRAGRATLELVNPAQRRLIDRLEVGREVSGKFRVAFEVDDSAAATDRLAAAGAELVAPPTRTPWGSLNARLEGPAGLQLTLFQELGEQH
jgi:tRNA(Arg) A34 adenosine deaminase TadA/predicted enzyme related to lactoylglutathione lyase